MEIPKYLHLLKNPPFRPSYPLLLIFLLLCFACIESAVAQDTKSVEGSETQPIEQMNEIQTALKIKLAARVKLRESIKSAESDDIPELQNTLSDLNDELRELRSSFEQIAVGDVDIGLFEERMESIDWRDELVQIMMPLMQNMKRITEKPRKIEKLRSEISLAMQQRLVTTNALLSLNATLGDAREAETKAALESLVQSWTDRDRDLGREISSANTQLKNLQRSNGPLWLRVRNGLWNFLKGRGLTLVMAAGAAFGVWYCINFVGRLSSRRVQGEDGKSFRTRQRIVHYGIKAVTLILIIIAMMVVFYTRGDILLMGVSFLLVAGAILGLRNTIPKFISETRLLLNFGSIREDERVIYQGLPWKVTQLNMQSVLKNPEISGIVRLPMEEMMGLVSRPAGKESWFPASKNDYILMDDGRILKLISLTPERVALENLAGTGSTVPTAEFFNASFENLTRSDAFSVSSTFGIGYSHQQDSVITVPEKFKSAVEAALQKTDLADDVLTVSVELQEAGASSLDYWIGVKMKSASAKSYHRVRRLIQQVCVTTCTQQNWDIPFPQLTLHRE